MKHIEKVRLATQMNGNKRSGMFSTVAWLKRRDAIKKRVADRLKK